MPLYICWIFSWENTVLSSLFPRKYSMLWGSWEIWTKPPFEFFFFLLNSVCLHISFPLFCVRHIKFQGLGKDGSGIKEPVQAKVADDRAGLGCQQRKIDPSLEAQSGDSYRTIIQKKAIARFREMSWACAGENRKKSSDYLSYGLVLFPQLACSSALRRLRYGSAI